MTVFLIIILGAALVGASFSRPGSFQRETWCSPGQTRLVEGLFTLLVVMSHYKNDYITPTGLDSLYISFQRHLGQCIVAIFLFYSGYGMMHNIMAKGKRYVLDIPKRFLKLFVQYGIAVVLFGLVRAALGKVYSPGDYLLTLLGWSSIGNSNWYIFAMLCLYILLFISFLPSLFSESWLEGRKRCVSLCLMLLLTALYIYAVKGAGKDYWWYDTVIIFPMGMIFRLVRDKAERIVMRNDITYFVTLAAVCAVYGLASGYQSPTQSFLLHEVWICAFTCIIVLLTMKVSFGSPLLAFAGKHVFSIYMLQRIPMLVLAKLGLTASHPYLALGLVFAITFAMAVPFDMLIHRLFSKKNGKQGEKKRNELA